MPVALSTLVWISAKPILKFLVMGGCGVLMARNGLLTPAGAKVVAGLILNYTLPALLFAKMLSCVNPENAQELGLVAAVAVLYILMGAFFGFLIQRTGKVPKRLYRGIIAATMFTNFGDLPISILLAVSDHAPFVIGDGARGTAYSSVFIAVFYLFLFPLGGYRLIRHDHVNESKRLASLTLAMETSTAESAAATTAAGANSLILSKGPLNAVMDMEKMKDSMSSLTDQQPQQQETPRIGTRGLRAMASEISLRSEDSQTTCGDDFDELHKQSRRQQQQLTLKHHPQCPLQQRYQQQQNLQQQQQQQRQQQQQQQHHYGQALAITPRSDTGIQSSTFSATSTMFSLESPTVEYQGEAAAVKELRYRPQEEEEEESEKAETNPFRIMQQQQNLEQPAGQYPSPYGQQQQQLSVQGQTRLQHPHPRLSVAYYVDSNTTLPNDQDYASAHHNNRNCASSPDLGDHDGARSSVESLSSNGTGTTRFSQHDDSQHTATRGGAGGQGRLVPIPPRIKTPLFHRYEPPPLPLPPSMVDLSFPAATLAGSSSSSRTGSPAPYMARPLNFSSSSSSSSTASPALSPMVHCQACLQMEMDSDSEDDETGKAKKEIQRAASTKLARMESTTIDLSAVQLESLDPAPKVPPALSRSFAAKQKLAPSSMTTANTTEDQETPKATKRARIQSWLKTFWVRFWLVFHTIREYLTPPTIGLILGLIVALTPLRSLFIVTPNPLLSSPDDLPPLSFIHEITLMLGGCCVPLGLTVLGASLSRLKPGRMRPLIPTLTMITVVKMVISPMIGIVLVQVVLVRMLGWIPPTATATMIASGDPAAASGGSNMLQFTLMLMSGSPTSITCFVLAQVWDKRTKNAGSEMAAVIAVQYAVGMVMLTVLSACMMYFLF